MTFLFFPGIRAYLFQVLMLKTTTEKNKNKYAQYFTPRPIAEFMVDLVDLPPSSSILEPCCGEGVFLDCLRERGFHNIVAYEIDPNLAQDGVRNESFVSASITEKFDLIIGNPPYIRWKNMENELKEELNDSVLWQKYCNPLCDYLHIFILKSVDLLKDNGRLIFICPEYWFNTTQSLGLRNYLMEHGGFECIYRFNETPIFSKVTVSTVIFKYIKTKNKPRHIRLTTYESREKPSKEVLSAVKLQAFLPKVGYDIIPQFRAGECWRIVPVTWQSEKLESECAHHSTHISLFDRAYTKIGDVCEIANGMVSGMDSAFQLDKDEIALLNDNEKKQTIKVAKAKDLAPYYFRSTHRYIFLQEGMEESELKEKYTHFYFKLLKHQSELSRRYNYNRDLKYWEWAFKRSQKRFASHEERILIPCKERISHKSYFRFAYAPPDVYATQDVTAIFKKNGIRESIFYILAFLNHPWVFSWIKINGVIKGNIVEFSEGPIARIPFRRINWNDTKEIELHDEVVRHTLLCIHQQNNKLIPQITEIMNQLLNAGKD